MSNIEFKEFYEKTFLDEIKINPYKLRIFPKKMQTFNICMEAVKLDGKIIKYIEKENLTPEICKQAIKNDANSMKYIPKEFLTQDIYYYAANINPYTLKYIPREYQRLESCLKAIKQDAQLIKYIKNKAPKLCFYAFLSNYSLLYEYKYIKNGINKFIKSNPTIINQVFCFSKYKINESKHIHYFEFLSLHYLKKFLFNNNNNKYIFDDKINVKILKDIALSNNELILIDTGNIKDIHKRLANKIIKVEDLLKESF